MFRHGTKSLCLQIQQFPKWVYGLFSCAPIIHTPELRYKHKLKIWESQLLMNQDRD